MCALSRRSSPAKRTVSPARRVSIVAVDSVPTRSARRPKAAPRSTKGAKRPPTAVSLPSVSASSALPASAPSYGCRPRSDFLGRLAHVPDETDLLEPFQEVVAHVDLPPIEALIGAVHVVVMVVVPTFAHADEREPRVVATGIRRFVAARTVDVGERVDGERPVQEKARRDDIAP